MNVASRLLSPRLNFLRRCRMFRSAMHSGRALTAACIRCTHSGNANRSTQLLRVALIGRPNVGKSTLYNRLTRTKAAIVTPIPGTTRDRRVGNANIAGMDFEVTDTGGLEREGLLEEQILRQSLRAAQSAHLVLFLVDGKAGSLTAEDLHFTNMLRKADLPATIRVVVNKTEGSVLNDSVQTVLSEASELGFGEPIAISAQHNEGMGELLEAVVAAANEHGALVESGANSSHSQKDKRLKKRLRQAQHTTGAVNNQQEPVVVDAEQQESESEDEVQEEREEDTDESEDGEDASRKSQVQLAIMGIPNVGKSSLLNAILGDERVITGPTPGVTRDAVSVTWQFQGRDFILVDTPGLEKLRSKHKSLEETLDDKVIQSAMSALKYANVVLLVVDPSLGGFRKTELKIIQRIATEGRACVIAANKADITEISPREYADGVRSHVAAHIYEFGKIPVVACSATEGVNIRNILPAVCKAYDRWNTRIPTATLNKWLQDTLTSTSAPSQGSKTVKIKYITQLKARPPSFALVANVSTVPESYLSFIRNRLQHDFRLDGVPIRIRVKSSKSKPPATK